MDSHHGLEKENETKVRNQQERWLFHGWIRLFPRTRQWCFLRVRSIKENASFIRMLNHLDYFGRTSSSPMSPWTTHARSTPDNFKASAMIWPIALDATPTTIRFGLAGLVSGPSLQGVSHLWPFALKYCARHSSYRLKMVRTPNSFRGPATRFMAGWNAWENKKQKLFSLRIEMAFSGVILISEQFIASSTSAEPHDELLDRFPCYYQDVSLSGTGGWYESRQSSTLATLRVLDAPATTIPAAVETLNVSCPTHRMW